MENSVKFFLEPDYTFPQHNSEIIVEVASELSSEEEKICWKQTKRGRQHEFRRRYYSTQKTLLEGINTDRKIIYDHQLSLNSAPSAAAAAAAATKDNSNVVKASASSDGHVFQILNSIFAILDVIAYCLSPAYPAILVPAFFLAFDSLRQTVYHTGSSSKSAGDSLLTLLFGMLLSSILIASAITLIYEPLERFHLNPYSTNSLFILTLTSVSLLVIMNILHNFNIKGIFLPQGAINFIMQVFCCFVLLIAQNTVVGKWSDIIFCTLMSLLVIILWIFPLSPTKEDDFNPSAYLARVGSVVLEHDSRIEKIHELSVEPINGRRILVDVNIVFNAECTAEEILRSVTELRRKFLQLDYVYKACISCC